MGANNQAASAMIAALKAAPEDPNGPREALARGLDPSAFQRGRWVGEYWEHRRRDAYRRADALMAGSIARLIAERDADRASLRAAEVEITCLKEGMEALGAALSPLAEAADQYDGIHEDACVVAIPGRRGKDLPRVRHLRAARDALAILSPKEQPHG